MEYLKLGGEYRLKNGENVSLIGTTHELSRDTQYTIVKPTVWCTELRQYGKVEEVSEWDFDCEVMYDRI